MNEKERVLLRSQFMFCYMGSDSSCLRTYVQVFPGYWKLHNDFKSASCQTARKNFEGYGMNEKVRVLLRSPSANKEAL